MTTRAYGEHGPFAVFDVETGPAGEIIALADRRGDPGGRAALHSLRAASVLLFDRSEEDVFTGFRLASWDVDTQDGGEAELIEQTASVLRPVHDAGGRILTFNGAHDMSVLSRRAARHWRFECAALPRWDPGAPRHLDLMRSGVGVSPGRYSSLVDSCAAFGVPAIVEHRGLEDVLPDRIRKGQVDVVCTYLLYLYAASAFARSPRPVVNGWTALAAWLASRPGRDRHLRQFVRHPHVRTARALLADRRIAQ